MEKRENCGHCLAGGNQLYRARDDDGWRCPYCGWYGFDNLGVPRSEGLVGREQVYPIATGKYSGR